MQTLDAGVELTGAHVPAEALIERGALARDHARKGDGRQEDAGSNGEGECEGGQRFTPTAPAEHDRVEREEEHRSSGIWISTPAGSTAGIKSAGGKVMPLNSKRLQYLVRELYREPQRSYALTHGFIAANEEIIVASKMQKAHLYVDGARTIYDFPFGTRAKIKIAEADLKIFISHEK